MARRQRPTHDITVTRGDRWTLPIVRRDPAGATIDLTGRVYSAQIRTEPDAATAITIAVATTEAATGKIVLSLTASQTDDIADGSWWDIEERLTVGADPRTFLSGRVYVEKDVTR